MEGELPDLKKKQEERKKAGLPIGGSGSAARAPFAGATGGSGAAVVAAAKAQPEAVRRLAARLGATLGGKLMTTAGLMLLLAASLALLHRVLFGTAQARMGGPPPE